MEPDESAETCSDSAAPAEADVLLLEPFFGGSHRQLVHLLRSRWPTRVAVYTLPAKKWHWRARTAALYFAQVVPRSAHYKVLFSSATLSLAELLGMRSDLASVGKKVVYFHENQLVYPVRRQQERDFQYGYNQITSCMAADRVVFNSQFNMASFLSSVDSFLKSIPAPRPRHVRSQLEAKCSVLYFPLDIAGLVHARSSSPPAAERPVLHVVWPHRWEHDKNPSLFFETLLRLADAQAPFELSVLGEQFQDVPAVFEAAKQRLAGRVRHWGFLPAKEDYYAVLRSGHVVVSTASHEFFGVAMLEAVACGCCPLCPNALVYPEIFPADCLFSTPQQLFTKLRHLCRDPSQARRRMPDMDLARFDWATLQPHYERLLFGDG